MRQSIHAPAAQPLRQTWTPLGNEEIDRDLEQVVKLGRGALAAKARSDF
jgi:hypothetical protein